MKELQYLLLTDGTSDVVMKVILDWLLNQLLKDTHFINGFHADPPPKKPASFQHGALSWRIHSGLFQYEDMDLLFVHRDAEKEDPQNRYDEVRDAVASLKLDKPPYVCVIPVRMTEAWLLIDEMAVRQAAGNPAGKIAIKMPSLKTLETEPDPKHLLYQLLKTASGRKGRKLDQFQPHKQVARVAELIEDYSPLRNLAAFQRLEEDVQIFIDTHLR